MRCIGWFSHDRECRVGVVGGDRFDGTADHSYDRRRQDLLPLQQHRIPVIPCTSKTAEEVRGFRSEAGLHDPYIVETAPWRNPRGEPGSRR